MSGLPCDPQVRRVPETRFRTITVCEMREGFYPGQERRRAADADKLVWWTVSFDSCQFAYIGGFYSTKGSGDYMGTATRPSLTTKEHPEHSWPDVLYLAMVVVSIAGLAYIFLKG